jgi:hypothetical protein
MRGGSRSHSRRPGPPPPARPAQPTRQPSMVTAVPFIAMTDVAPFRRRVLRVWGSGGWIVFMYHVLFS